MLQHLTETRTPRTFKSTLARDKPAQREDELHRAVVLFGGGWLPGSAGVSSAGQPAIGDAQRLKSRIFGKQCPIDVYLIRMRSTHPTQ